jgi:hypothetical protein
VYVKQRKLEEIDVANLVLDVNNPRFAELYSGSDDQDELIEYLLYEESAEEIAKEIVETDEFYTDRPLWVVAFKGKKDKYLVKDGNRRCGAVKALLHPRKYDLDYDAVNIETLPVVFYEDEAELEYRIRREHTASLFRQWDRIAKALEVHEMYDSGSSIESMKDIDSSPADLVKLANFYYEAVKIGGEDFKQLIRRGRGKTGGKTIIFERLFRYKEKCGYTFKNKPSYLVSVSDRVVFRKYITSMVRYLKDNPDTTTKKVDDAGESFLDKLKDYGFIKKEKNTKTGEKINDPEDEIKETSSPNAPDKSGKRKSIKTRPVYYRKRIPRPLVQLIDECYDLDPYKFANAKTALVRVTFENILKYIVDSSSYNSRKLASSSHFRNAFYDKGGAKLPTTNFEKLKSKFTELVLEKGKREAFNSFKLDDPHQIIHNYNVGAVPANAISLCDNLLPLIEFMLQEEKDLIASLDTAKL